MNRKKILSCILTGFICIGLFIGCNQTNNKVTSISDTEKVKVLNDLRLYSVDSTHTLNEMENTISKNIEAFEEKDKDEIISLYISQMYTSSNDLNKKLTTIGYELEDVLKKDETININDKKTWNKIPETNGTVKGFLEEIKAKGFTLKKNSDTSNYQISINNENILDKYGNNMSPSLKEYLDLNAYEETAPSLGNQEDKTVNLDEAVKRILIVEKGIDTDKSQGYSHIDKWMSSSDYYYSILLGLSHDFFISSDYFNEDILSKYTDIAQKNSGTKLAEILTKVVKIYTDSNRKVDETVIANIEKAVTDILYTTEIKDALKVVIEANKNENLSTQNTPDTSVLDSIITSDAITDSSTNDTESTK